MGQVNMRFVLEDHQKTPRQGVDQHRPNFLAIRASLWKAPKQSTPVSGNGKATATTTHILRCVTSVTVMRWQTKSGINTIRGLCLTYQLYIMLVNGLIN